MRHEVLPKLLGSRAAPKLGLDPPASCRVSFTVYNSPDDVARVVAAVRQAVRKPERFRPSAASARIAAAAERV